MGGIVGIAKIDSLYDLSWETELSSHIKKE
jgi:hypothetical protein